MVLEDAGGIMLNFIKRMFNIHVCKYAYHQIRYGRDMERYGPIVMQCECGKRLWEGVEK